MPETLCLFEDDRLVDLRPLTFLRPVYELRCGILTLREKFERAFPRAELRLHCRPHLAALVAEMIPGRPINALDADDALFVNGRAIAGADFAKEAGALKPGEALVCGDVVVAARLSGEALRRAGERLMRGPADEETFGALERRDTDVPLIDFPWQLVKLNCGEIERDFERLGAGRVPAAEERSPGVYLLNESGIHVGAGSKLRPGVVLDAEAGPVYVGDGATLMPGAVVVGPAYVGGGSVLKIHAKIYPGTSIGPVCKVGGEVDSSVIHSYANKPHDGFLGHSYLGQWVNLGAATDNSNLKNNYGLITVTINGREVNSGERFVGLTAGDHTKCAIGTTFNTGTVVGVSSNIFGGGFFAKYVPSFAWGGAGGFVKYDLERAIGTARIAMDRRHVPLTPAYEQVLRHVYLETASEQAI